MDALFFSIHEFDEN